MKPVCIRCGRFVGLRDVPLFLAQNSLLALFNVEGKFVCSKCSRKDAIAQMNMLRRKK